MTTAERLRTIKNFHVVADGFYRGAQPSAEGIEYLAGMGVKTILSLRCGRRAAAAEKAAAEAAGMRYENIPLSYWKVPTEETIDRFLELLDDPKTGPIFIHCFHGADRTGLMVATYRISRLGWSFQEAYDEMKRCGFHRFGVRHFKWVLWFYAQRAQMNMVGNNQPILNIKST
jgi:protein tyrosine/serine phosphatase